MTRLKAWLSGAAALVIAGGTIALSLMQSAQEQTPPVSCVEGCELFSRVADSQQWPRFFVAMPQGVATPSAYGATLLGDCQHGTCSIRGPASCPCGIDYAYEAGPLVDGYRAIEVRAPATVARGWRAWANESGEARWLGGFRDAVAKCLELTTAAKCLQLFDAGNRCWLLSTGDICRYGYLVRTQGPGDDPPLACPYAQVVSPMPCTVDRGAGSEMVDATADLDAELDAEAAQ